MTIRNLHAVFAPRSVALIGASERIGSVGRVLTENLSSGDFSGPLMLVNPKRESVLGLPAYPDVASLPSAPDVAVIAIPAPDVPGVVAALAERGTRGAVVISAGFSRQTERGRALTQAMLDAARPALLRIVGPNSLGVLVPQLGLNASFAHLTPKRGHLAFLAQSGAIITSVLDWAHARGIGFSHLVSLGDMADVDLGDMLDYLANDHATRGILLYVEAVTQPRKFMSAARAAARMKPVIVVKGGRHEESGRAAASHTGVLAGRDAEYDAAFRRAGMLRVLALEELFGAVETLAVGRPPRGPRLAILTNGGGIGVLASDALLDAGGELAHLSEATLRALDDVLPATWSRANPIDIVGDATAERYARAVRIVLDDPDLDGVLVLHCPTAVASGLEAAHAVIDAAKERPGVTLLTSWVGDFVARAAREAFQASRVATFDTPEHAARAFMQMADYRRNQALLMEVPPSLPARFTPDAQAARRLLDRAAAEQRQWLTGADAKEVLAAYGVPVVVAVEAATPEEAAGSAAQLGVPVALKISSPDILHKTEVGGVVLDLVGPDAVRSAAQEMLERARNLRPQARIRGFTVEVMARRSSAPELIIGVSSEGDFGPVILFGQGGTAVEVIADTALALPPLNLKLAYELMKRTRVYKQLGGYRNVPAADLDAVALTLTRVSQLIADFPRIVELDINPLLVDATGVLALDARIRIDSTVTASRFAIRPYPKELEQDVPLADGRVLFLRPILPEDAPALQAGFARLSPDEVRARFFVPLKVLSPMAAARFTQIDYDREMALVLTEHEIPGKADIFGVVRISADPDNEAAEFAIVIERRFTGRGLGALLMQKIIDYAAARGIGELFGDVLRDNVAMLNLCRFLGFSESRSAEDPNLIRVSRKLR